MTIVTPVRPEHVEAFAALAEEMDRFYGVTDQDPLDVRLRQIRDVLFGDGPSAYALIAWIDGRPVGFAAYAFLWPAVGFTRSVFLKELYVVDAARRSGAGRALMRSVAEIAVKNGCSRFEWQTDTPNTGARRFYEDLGVPVNASKLSYRVEGEALQALADGR